MREAHRRRRRVGTAVGGGMRQWWCRLPPLACRPVLTLQPSLHACPPTPCRALPPQVAALVPGKTKAQCFRRFKELKESHKAAKAKA